MHFPFNGEAFLAVGPLTLHWLMEQLKKEREILIIFENMVGFGVRLLSTYSITYRNDTTYSVRMVALL